MAIECGRLRRRSTGTVFRRDPTESTMNPIAVVIISELGQLARQIHPILEEDVIEKLAPDSSDQPFNKRMRHR
jgi:hypothetical protein